MLKDLSIIYGFLFLVVLFVLAISTTSCEESPAYSRTHQSSSN